MLLFEDFLVASSHVILAFSQAALVVGIFMAANPGEAKATARPAATMIETRFFIVSRGTP